MSQPPKLKLVRPDDESSSARGLSHPTVSIAVPGSVVSNAQTRELQTQLAGQIARAAAVYRVDEVIVFDDGLGSTLNTVSNYRRGPRRRDGDEGGGNNDRRPPDAAAKAVDGNGNGGDIDDDKGRERRQERPAHMRHSTDPHAFLARMLQYCECPQYLRRRLFPVHPDLQFAGLLPPLDAPHHLRRGDTSLFREGVVVAAADDKEGDGGGRNKEGGVEEGSLVDCGVPNRLVRIDRVLTPGIRCTVRLEPKAYETKQKSTFKKGVMMGEVVSPTAPRDEEGIYWGYTTRLALSINAIFEECPYEGGYDLKVGTSERGDVSIDDPKFRLGKMKGTSKKKSKSVVDDDSGVDDDRFDHLLIVFGGVAGIEESVDADESMKLSGEHSREMFDVWVNVCPYQGSRTIRSEEAVLITLSRLSPHVARNVASSSLKKGKEKNKVAKTEEVEFSDEAVSEESSDEE